MGDTVSNVKVNGVIKKLKDDDGTIHAHTDPEQHL